MLNGAQRFVLFLKKTYASIFLSKRRLYVVGTGICQEEIIYIVQACSPEVALNRANIKSPGFENQMKVLETVEEVKGCLITSSGQIN